MNYVVAVSGGVDSVVLLDMLARQPGNHLVVAHVDHGIRGDESAADARFVKALARQYGVPFVSIALHLPPTASEEVARTARYDFLLKQAAEFKAQLVTAHHQGDAVETVAINIARGTGWRGLAVFHRPEVYRPLVAMSKKQLYDYAMRHKLEWVEDATNGQDVYTRNRIRRKINSQGVDSVVIMQLRAKQLQLLRDITKEVDRLLRHFAGSRYAMTMIPEEIACELIGAEVAKIATRPMRPRLLRAVRAIKTAAAGSTFELGDGVIIKFTTRNYTLSVI